MWLFFRFQQSEKNTYLVLEYCAGGDLENFIGEQGKLPEWLVRKFLYDLGCMENKF